MSIYQCRIGKNRKKEKHISTAVFFVDILTPKSPTTSFSNKATFGMSKS